MKAEKTRNFLRYYFPYNAGFSREKEIENLEKDSALKELAELERLAEIGKATERLLDDEIERYMVSGRIVEGKFIDTKAIESVDELLEWYNAI